MKRCPRFRTTTQFKKKKRPSCSLWTYQTSTCSPMKTWQTCHWSSSLLMRCSESRRATVIAETWSQGFKSRKTWLFHKAERESYSTSHSKTNRSSCLRHYRQGCCIWAVMQNHWDNPVADAITTFCAAHLMGHTFPSTSTRQHVTVLRVLKMKSAFSDITYLWRSFPLSIHRSVFSHPHFGRNRDSPTDQ